MRSLSHRICRPCAQLFDWIVYTDAATTPPRICALRFQGASQTPRLVQTLSPAVPLAWMRHFRSTCLIFGLEIMALAAFLGGSAAELDGCSIWFYMDIDNSLAALTRGLEYGCHSGAGGKGMGTHPSLSHSSAVLQSALQIKSG